MVTMVSLYKSFVNSLLLLYLLILFTSPSYSWPLPISLTRIISPNCSPSHIFLSASLPLCLSFPLAFSRSLFLYIVLLLLLPISFLILCLSVCLSICLSRASPVTIKRSAPPHSMLSSTSSLPLISGAQISVPPLNDPPEVRGNEREEKSRQ